MHRCVRRGRWCIRGAGHASSSSLGPASRRTRLMPPLLVLMLVIFAASTARAKDVYGESLVVRRVGRGQSRIYAEMTFDSTWEMEDGQLCHGGDERPPRACASDLFPPGLSALVHAHGVQELFLSLSNTRWERDLWGHGGSNSSDSIIHADPPFGAEAWARLLPNEEASDGSQGSQWRQLLEGLGALYHAPLGLTAQTAAASSSVIGGVGGVISPGLTEGAFQLSIGGDGDGGYGHGHEASPAAPARLLYGHLPLASLCTDTLAKALLGTGGSASLLSPCRGRITTTEPSPNNNKKKKALHGLVALLALALREEDGRRLLTADYLGYTLELRRVCRQRDGPTCLAPALQARQRVRLVLPAPSPAASLIDALSTTTTSSSWLLHPCDIVDAPAASTVAATSPSLLAGLGIEAQEEEEGGGFRVLQQQEEEEEEDEAASGRRPERWVTVSRSRGQAEDVTRGVLRTWLRNDHPSQRFRAEVMDTIPFFIAPGPLPASLRATASEGGVDLPIEAARFRPGEGKEPSLLEYALELPPASLVQVALPFETRFLHFEDFPPNPSRGLDVPPAIVGLRVVASSGHGHGNASTARLATAGLLVEAPTPDFSMPFNVITLTSTLVAFFFGSMLNVLVRKGRRESKKEDKGKRSQGGLAAKLRALVQRVKGRLRGAGAKEKEEA